MPEFLSLNAKLEKAEEWLQLRNTAYRSHISLKENPVIDSSEKNTAVDAEECKTAAICPRCQAQMPKQGKDCPDCLLEIRHPRSARREARLNAKAAPLYEEPPRPAVFCIQCGQRKEPFDQTCACCRAPKQENRALAYTWKVFLLTLLLLLVALSLFLRPQTDKAELSEIVIAPQTESSESPDKKVILEKSATVKTRKSKHTTNLSIPRPVDAPRKVLRAPNKDTAQNSLSEYNHYLSDHFNGVDSEKEPLCLEDWLKEKQLLNEHRR